MLTDYHAAVVPDMQPGVIILAEADTSHVIRWGRKIYPIALEFAQGFLTRY